MRTQLRERRLRVAADIVRKVESVQAVDTDKQNMPDSVSGIVVLGPQSCTDRQNDQKQREAAHK